MKVIYLFFFAVSILSDTSPEKTELCSACESTVNWIHSTITSELSIFIMILAMKLLKSIIETGCGLVLKNDDFCNNVFEGIVRIWATKLLGIFDPLRICVKLEICTTPKIIPDINKNFINRVLLDRPPKQSYSIPSKGNTVKFVLFADMHVDYEYKEVISD